MKWKPLIGLKQGGFQDQICILRRSFLLYIESRFGGQEWKPKISEEAIEFSR